MIQWYVGVDWGDETHVVVVQDRESREVSCRNVEHSGRGLAELTSWLEDICEGDVQAIAVAIEVPHGPVVGALLAHGFQVFAANPKQVDRFRDRFSPAGAKDDRLDAFVLGTALRTDPQAFRRLQAEDPQHVRLRGLLGVVKDLKQELRRLANRLRAELHDYFPQPLRFAPAADEAWLWNLLELAPLPEQAARLSRRRVERLLREKRIRRFTAEQLLAELATMPLPVMPGIAEAAAQHVRLLIPRLRLAEEQLRRCQRDLERLVDQICSQAGHQSEHRDAQILRSMPGAGSFVVATMLAEAAEPLARRDYHALRAQSGIAPVTRRSGKTIRIHMRQACNPRLRLAVFYWAAEAKKHDPRLHCLYFAHRSRGHGHARALRSVGDRLLALLFVLLDHDVTYDPELRSAA
jgi:hypothetical protein